MRKNISVTQHDLELLESIKSHLPTLDDSKVYRLGLQMVAGYKPPADIAAVHSSGGFSMRSIAEKKFNPSDQSATEAQEKAIEYD